jgi:hypothetical protein
MSLRAWVWEGKHERMNKINFLFEYFVHVDRIIGKYSLTCRTKSLLTWKFFCHMSIWMILWMKKWTLLWISLDDSANLSSCQHLYFLFTLINRTWFNLHIHNIYLSHLDVCLKLLIFNKNKISSILVSKSNTLNPKPKSNIIPIYIHVWWSQWIMLVKLS